MANKLRRLEQKVRESTKKAQTALEYLMTYSWAILLVALVAAVLYFVAFTSYSTIVPNTCIFTDGAYCQDLIFTSNTANTVVAILLNNAQSVPLAYPSVSVNYSGTVTSSTCFPDLVNEGGAILCTVPLPQKGVTLGSLVNGKIQLTVKPCPSAVAASCIGTANQIYVGTFTVHASSTILPFCQIVGTVPVSPTPDAAAYNPGNGYMYVTNDNSNTVSIISQTKVVGTVNVGSYPVTGGSSPYAIAYNPSNGDMYVANWNAGTVSVISGTKVLATVTVGTNPAGIAYNPGNKDMYVSNFGSGTVSVISGTTVVATVTGLSSPYGIAYNPTNGDMYVANHGSSTVSLISGSTVVGAVGVGSSPQGVAYNPTNGDMYVTIVGAASVVVVSGTTVVGTVGVFIGPDAVAYDPSNGYMYVTGGGSLVDIISGTTLVSTVKLGSGITNPYGVAYNPNDGYMYVVNFRSATASLVSCI